MKRWQLELMGVMLLTLVLVYLCTPWNGIQLAVILWLAGRGTILRAAGDRPIKAAVRFVIAGLAAVGCLVSISYTQALRFLPDMPDMPRPLVEKWPIAFVACSCLFVYWLEDAYEMVPLDGIGRTILRGAVSLILASFAAIGFAVAYVLACYLAHPVEGPVYSGWLTWVLLFSGFAVPFYGSWKLLSLRDHHST
jgi:hypothetical protein